MTALLLVLAVAVESLSPIWSQTVSFTLPSGFVTKFENASQKSGHYVREAVLRGETVDDWTQMITVTGERGIADVAGSTPKTFAETIAGDFQKACPDSFAAAPIGKSTTSGYDSYAAVLSCGTSPTTNGATSESAVILVVAGKRDFYTLQWAVRTKPSATPMHLDLPAWKARLAQLKPIHIE